MNRNRPQPARVRKPWLFLLASGFLVAASFSGAAAHENEGFIYGKVSTRSGNTYQGIIRWGTEEAFWDDLFHSYKESRPYEDYLEEHGDRGQEEVRDLERDLEQLEKDNARLDREIDKLSGEIAALSEQQVKTTNEDKRRELADQTAELSEKLSDMASEKADNAVERAEMERERKNTWSFGPEKSLSIFGGKLNINWNDNWSGDTRIFIARFGDIKKIQIIGSEDAELTMRTGTRYVASGYSNDVGGTIVVNDDKFGTVELDWKKIDTIEFMETPATVKPDGYRLHGNLSADGGEYSGFIQWDSEECISTDKLDGDSEDGRLSIPMGNIRSIERRSRGSAWVEMKDGRKLQLEGTNDVDQSIRGIMVEDPRYGRLKVPWEAFDKLVFDDKSGSGEGYDDYAPKKLQATVKDMEGESHTGLMVFDLDESESWEILNGDLFDTEFDVPFANIVSIVPRSRNACEVTLKSGEKLRLEGGQDVTEANDGVLIFNKGETREPVYIDWDRVERIDFK